MKLKNLLNEAPIKSYLHKDKKKIDISAKDFAKEVFHHKLDTLFYWSDAFPEEHRNMTVEERHAVNAELVKLAERAERYLNISSSINKNRKKAKKSK